MRPIRLFAAHIIKTQCGQHHTQRMPAFAGSGRSLTLVFGVVL